MSLFALSRPCAVAVVTALAFSLAGPPPAYAAVPSEATWKGDVAEAMAGSKTYLERRAGSGGRLAINLDIDNTALASHYDSGHATTRVLRFARQAHRHHVSVLFNTARPQGDVKRTARVLRREGYPVDGICGRRSGESAVESKQRCRHRFHAAGYALVANVGNNPTDFRGGGYERAYRLPNYHGQLT